MPGYKFDPAKLEKLNDPGRFVQLDPVAMWHAVGEPQPDVIVEIGAGTGMFAARFAQMAPGAAVWALDSEPTMVEWMRENRGTVADGRIEPLLGAAEAVPLDDDVADLVVMINLHHELNDADAAYREARRILRAGGQILVVDWAARETPKGPPLKVRADERELAAALESAGFRDVHVHEELPWHWMLTAGA